MRFTKNKNYWQSGKPYLDEIVMNVRKDGQAMLADLEAGTADLIYGSNLVDFVRLKADQRYTAQLLSPPAGFYQFQPNVTFKPLDDKRVRQALNYAIDRKRITETAMLGVAQPEDLPWPTSSPAYETDKNSHFAFDLDRAKSLLAQAGASGLELEFAYAPILPEYATMVQIYQSDLARIGVKLNIVSMDIPAMVDSIHNQKYKGLYTLNDSWATMEPASTFNVAPTLNPQINNAGYTHDDTYAQMVNDARAEPDIAKRKQLYSQLNDYLLDQSFVMPISPTINRVVTSASVHGIEFRRNDIMFFRSTWIG
jgi:peptide/nickel transport system substrate-binding protein